MRVRELCLQRPTRPADIRTYELAAPTKELERLLDVNVKGTFFCYKYAAMQLIKQGNGGRIIGAGSIASKKGP